ncbi:MAG TPA: gluconeogenesis factor YvcK family protein [Patescibacteria group bacterium]|nr:gluconeogenesis factor YvcK family protein [Patescibacteria group bacterium]
MNKLPNIVCIGGGTGTFVALKGLKHFPSRLSAIVTMSDSGGSNQRIRDEFGLLPTSDIRQCLVALSDENGGVGLLRKLFMYRFEKGRGIRGMTFGNLFMAALSDILGSQEEAIRQTGKVLRIQGTVIPVSLTDTNLFAVYEDGHILTEEHLIDEPPHDGKMAITDVYLKPKAKANPEALQAIAKADLIVLGPGDLYTSLLPNLLIRDVSQAISASKAKKIYIVNLMTKYGQTYNYTAGDHVNVIEKYIGKTLNYVILNNGKIPESALTIYEKGHEVPVVDNLKDSGRLKIIRADLVSKQFTNLSKSDTLVRSLIRHDSDKLASELIRLT